MRDTLDLFNEPAADSDSVSEVTFHLALHFEGERSINVSETGAGKVITLPRSEIRYARTGQSVVAIDRRKLAIVSVTLPEWLAIDRGLA